MGAQEYINTYTTQLADARTDIVQLIGDFHLIRETVVVLSNRSQTERLKESDTALSNTMELNVSSLHSMDKTLTDLAEASEALPTLLRDAEDAHARLQAALPSTS